MRGFEQLEAFAVGLHHRVLDAVVNHLDKMAGAIGTGVQIAVRAAPGF